MPSDPYAVPVGHYFMIRDNRDDSKRATRQSDFCRRNDLVVAGDFNNNPLPASSVPRSDLAKVPFDALLLSNVYGFFHVVGNRRSYQNKIRGHIYASAVADLPWNNRLAAEAKALGDLRFALLKASERRYEQATKLAEEARALGLRPLKEVVRDRTGAKVGKKERCLFGRAHPDVDAWKRHGGWSRLDSAARCRGRACDGIQR